MEDTGASDFGGSREGVIHTTFLFALWSSIAITGIYSLARCRNLLVSMYLTYLKLDDEGDQVPLEYGAASHKRLKAYADNVLEQIVYRQAITVQICTYNEGHVAVESITRACHLDWPADLLTVLVCDDSTEASSSLIIDDAVRKLHDLGHNVNLLRRPDREGYKAGSLAYHFPYVSTEFIAHLDADHWVEPDWLKLMMPRFFHFDGRLRLQIACVQAPWAYYNTHTNLLTECDAAGLDYHHTVEQPARSYLFQVFGFNGTGGLWRRQAVADAGGWSFDTVTEDLSLSYEAYLAGYRMTYVSDLPQRLELPACILSHVQQKSRWTKGFFQVFRRTYPRLLRSSTTPPIVKAEAFLHMTAVAQTVCSMMILIFYPYVMYHHLDSKAIRWTMVALIFEPVVSFVHMVFAKVPNGDYTTTHSRLARLFLIVPYMGLNFGILGFQCKAMLEGLTSEDATFLSTPKDGVAKGPNRTSNRRAIVKPFWTDDVAAGVGLLLGLHHLLYVLVYDNQHASTTHFHTFVRLANAIIVAGLLIVNGAFLWQKHCHEQNLLGNIKKIYDWKIKHRRRFWCLVIAATFLVSSLSSAKLQYTISLQMPKLVSSRDQLVAKDVLNCPVEKENNARTMLPPVVIFSEPRSGSSLFLDMLSQVDRYTDNADLCLSNFHELFSDRHSGADLWYDAKHLAEAEGVTNVAWGAHDMSNATKWQIYETVRKFIPMDTWPRFCRFFQTIENLNVDTNEALTYLSNSLKPRPACEENASYFAIKIFKHMVQERFINPANFIHVAMDRANLVNGKVFIVWRRRVVESYVSYQLAAQKDAWRYSATGTTDQIVVDRKKLEAFVASRRQYYLGVKQALEAQGISYEIFEYDRDLVTPDKQRHTIRRIMKSFGLSTDMVTTAEESRNQAVAMVQQHLDLVKQAQAPVETQVSNWDQVIQWGFANVTEEWEDLFAEDRE